MDRFEGRIAVVTGGGTGIGRELVRQLAAAGAHVSMCDLSEANMAESKALAEKEAPAGTRITTFVADVADEARVNAFRDHVVVEHGAAAVHLLFNNAGIGGGGSFVAGDRDEWERTFGVCWGGVYNGCRAFVPLLVAAEEAHLVNVSSVNGFWASLGPQTAHTAYSAAKFAVKGFTEALVNDLRLNAPHVGVSVVMPGHIGTSIVINSMAILGHQLEDPSLGELFRDSAPTSAEQAAATILDGVRERRWRILVGDDARALDERVRLDPERAYDPSFTFSG